MALVIVNKLGVVHDTESHCRVVNQVPVQQRKAITALQAATYKLPSCGVCWPNVTTFERAIQARTGR